MGEEETKTAEDRTEESGEKPEMLEEQASDVEDVSSDDLEAEQGSTGEEPAEELSSDEIQDLEADDHGSYSEDGSENDENQVVSTEGGSSTDLAESRATESEDLLTSARQFLSDDRPQRFVIGFLFGMAFFFITAGLAEVLLARNESCIAQLSDFRLAPNPNEVCMSEFEFYLARGMSRGIMGIFSPETSVFVAWPAMAIFFGLLGGGLAQLPLRAAIIGFAIVYVLLLMAFMSVDFMSQFIVLE